MRKAVWPLRVESSSDDGLPTAATYGVGEPSIRQQSGHYWYRLSLLRIY